MSERPPTLPVSASATTSPASSTTGGTGTGSHSHSSSSYYSTSATSQSPSTPTPTVHSLAPTPAPSRNPSLFPGAENSPVGLNGSRGVGGVAAHLSAAQPGRHFADNADYINALAAAAQASLQSAPSSPGADLPIARSSGKRNSIYGLGGGSVAAEGSGGGGAAQEPALSLLPERLSGLQVDEEREAEERETQEKDGGMDEANGEGGWRNEEAGGPMDLQEPQPEQQLFGDAGRGSFLDVDSSTPATTPGFTSAAAAGDYFHGHEAMPGASGLRTEDRSGGVTGGPVSSAAARDVDEMEVEEEGEYEGFTDPFARARAGVSVAKGEGLVVQAGAMMNGQQEERPPPQERPARDRQQSWSEQDLRHEMTARLYKGEAMQGYESTTDKQ